MENQGPLLSGTKRRKVGPHMPAKSDLQEDYEKVRCKREQSLSCRIFKYLEM